MYAVGKVGSLISRSVYSVSAPFHPFGGAVDIVVVHQQDGSFKSSPWYVRFGKFQGVLKTREKVVNISVNGVEAGFHMYLDSNGEAYFLRDADPNGEEGEFIVSPASSGDEQEAPTLRKSKSTSCDSSTMEADVVDNKILARTTTTRRTTILERMFGRKSVKQNSNYVDRVSSLERAEIAAELLDTKWSTNLSRGSQSPNSNDQPCKSIIADAGSSDQLETSETVLPEHSFDHGKEMEPNCSNSECNPGSPSGGRNCSANQTDNCLQTTSVKEEVVEIYTHDNSDIRMTATTDQAESEYFSNDLGTDKSIPESVDTQDGSLHNFEHVTGREMHTEDFLSDSVFEIHAVDTEISNCKTEVASHFVTGDSDLANQNSADTNLPTYHTTDVSIERHELSSVSSVQDVIEDKMVIISSTETVESYAMSSIFANKVHDAVDTSFTSGVHVEEHPMTSHGTVEQLIEYRASSNKEDKVNVVLQGNQGHADSVLEDLQASGGPDMESSVGTVLDYHSIDSSHNLACKHDVVCPDASSNVVEILMPENIPEDATKEPTVEKKAYSEEFNVSVTQASSTGEGSTECITQFLNFSNNWEAEDLPTVTDESEEQTINIDDDANMPISISGGETQFMQEETEAVVSFAELTEEIQFQFSDTESFTDTTVMDGRADKKADEGESDCDAEEQQTVSNDYANDVENCSVPLISETSPLPIPGSELHSGDNSLGVKSLPNLRSHIHDLERSDGVPLSHSLRSNPENNEVEPVKNMDFTEKEPEATGDPEENSKEAEHASNSMPKDEHNSDLKVDSFNPVVGEFNLVFQEATS
jgi:phosphatidate phosphatase LPIN